MKDARAESQYEVVWPLAAIHHEDVTYASRPVEVANRRIGLLWNNLFRGDEMLDVLKSEISSQFDGVEFVDHEVFGNIHGHDEDEVFERLPEILRQTKVDSVIVAVGA